jgi:small neutral amino acid transporter SnatA (MarC family)
MKRFILAFVAAYIFIFLWGWLLNGVFLKISMRKRQISGGRKVK